MADIDLGRLKRNWGVASVLAIAIGVLLQWVDMRLIAATEAGILDLEFARTGEAAFVIIEAWKRAGVAGEAGFLLGLDYLYMPAYGFALYFGGVAAREAFARTPGVLRTLFSILAAAPLLAAGLDVVENAGEVHMLFIGPEPEVQPVLWWFTVAKFALVTVGGLGALAGLAGLFMGRLRSPRPHAA